MQEDQPNSGISIADLVESGIPESMWHHQHDTYSGSQQAIEDCVKYSNQFLKAKAHGVGLFIIGEPDTQKTFLATYVLRVLLVDKFNVLYVSFPDLVDKLLKNEVTLRDLFTRPDCVVIDNLCSAGNSFWPTALSRALTIRKDAGKPTICVTPLSRDLFEAQYGEPNLKMIERNSKTIFAEMDDAQRVLLEQRRKDFLAEEIE